MKPHKCPWKTWSSWSTVGGGLCWRLKIKRGLVKLVKKTMLWGGGEKLFLWNVTKSLYGLAGNHQMNRQDIQCYLIIKQNRVTEFIIIWYFCQFTVSFKCRVSSVKKIPQSIFEAEIKSMCFGAGCTKQPEREESVTVRAEQIIQTTLTALKPTSTRERGKNPAMPACQYSLPACWKKRAAPDRCHLGA